MTQTLVQVRIDRKLKEQTASIYEAIGMDLPAACRAKRMIRAVIDTNMLVSATHISSLAT